MKSGVGRREESYEEPPPEFIKAHEDPMYDIIQENKRHKKDIRIQQSKQLLEDSASDDDGSSSSSSEQKRKKRKRRKKRKHKSSKSNESSDSE
ncbi:hypothetical protein MG293_006483 [Ovis ammon polii]|uniref:Uncharacterized protein n=1 Tax=Ovis ammon polii TaxID=230172 RepID=A0AAD4UFE0_OVIAM|nr:hypothetical protein MG293_006483 [Ovis ammon polii]